MITRIQKWGNGQGIHFPQWMLDKLRVSVGDEVEITVHGEKIIIRPASTLRGKYNLKELLASMPEDYSPGEFDWVGPVGREIW